LRLAHYRQKDFIDAESIAKASIFWFEYYRIDRTEFDTPETVGFFKTSGVSRESIAIFNRSFVKSTEIDQFIYRYRRYLSHKNCYDYL